MVNTKVSNARGLGSFPDWGTKIPHAVQHGQNNDNNHNNINRNRVVCGGKMTKGLVAGSKA